MKHVCLLTVLLVGGFAWAAKPSNNSGLSTDIRFNALEVSGKYQYADEALAVVEDDKILDDLLSIRKDFKDRLRKETKRQ